MKSLRTYLLVGLSATTIGGALLAWRQYGELVELRAAALGRSERADLQKRVWDLEKLNRELQARTGAERLAADPRPGPADRSPTPADRGGRGDPRGRGETAAQINAVRDLLAKPEVQAMISLQQRAGIEARYAALFKNLNLTSEQAEKLTNLIAERGNTRQDVFSAAREQGIDPRANPEAFRKLLADSQNEINAGIKAVVGESGLSQLLTYEQTMPQRTLVNELQQRLSYTSTPLTAAQSEQLVQILAANAPAPAANATTPPPGPPGPGRGPGMDMPGFGRGGDLGGIVMNMVAGAPGPGGGMPPMIESAMRVSGAPVTTAAIAQAQTVLAPPQVAALQQIQQQQQGQQQLQQMIRDTVMPNPRPDGAAPAAPAGGTQPARPPGKG